MKNLQFNSYRRGAGRGEVGLKSLNPSLPVSPHSCPITFAKREKLA